MFYIFSVVVILMHLFLNFNVYVFYFYNFLLGLVSGYWILFLLITAENFGTNIRFTVIDALPI